MVPPNALSCNRSECAVAFDYIQSKKHNERFDPGRELSWKGSTGHWRGSTSQHPEKNLRNDGEPDVDCYTKTLNHRKTQENNLPKIKRIRKPEYSKIRL